MPPLSPPPSSISPPQSALPHRSLAARAKITFKKLCSCICTLHATD